MSYSCCLIDQNTKNVIILDNPINLFSCNIAIGGSKEASMDITYNYAEILHKALESPSGIFVLNGMTAAKSLKLLTKACETLGNDVDDDYWKPTEGNVKRALLSMLCLAMLVPKDSVWDIC